MTGPHHYLSRLMLLSIAWMIPCRGLPQSNDGQSSPAIQQVPLQNRPGVLDGPDSPIASLREHGIDLTVSYTEFGQGLIVGADNHSWRLGGKMLGKVTLDRDSLHLWKGFSITGTGELNNGANVNEFGGTVLIKNAALAFPQDAGTGGDFSLNVSQKFGDRVSLSIGKFDMINAPSRTPILGGGGLDAFWNVAFAAPPSGVLPPYVTGGNLSISTKIATVSMMLYDPSNSQQKVGLKGWGTQGITGRISARFSTKFRTRPGYHTLTFATSSQTGLNLEDLPQLFLPRESPEILGKKSGYYFGSYAVQQYFRQDPSRPGSGWGMFAQVSFSDSNPNPLAGNLLAGLGGTGLWKSRPWDRVGIGYFCYFFSDALKQGLENTEHFKLGDEQGMEAFYNFALTRWFRIAADVQIIEPGNRQFHNEVYAGISGQLRF